MSRIGQACLVGTVLFATVAGAATGGPIGLWDRDDGLGGVRISPCGAALCGHVVWLRDKNGPGHVGQRVLSNLHKTAADTWTGSAVNPADGQTYAGTLTVAGSRMVTRGCALGGIICQNVALTRAR